MASSIVPADSSKPSLPRRPLGATGLEVSVIGFGASPLGSVFEVRKGMLERRETLAYDHNTQT